MPRACSTGGCSWTGTAAAFRVSSDSVDAALILSAGLLGLAGGAHCAAMCGPACAALTAVGPARSWSGPVLAFHCSRVAGYATAGALLAGGLQWLAWAGQGAVALRPLWAMLHMAALALGAWMLLTASQPRWMSRAGRSRPASVSPADAAEAQVVFWPGRTAGNAMAGSVWVLWPCGLLQSALVVAGLTQSAAVGAAAMGTFALASAPGLLAAPWLGQRLGATGIQPQWAVRLAGLLLAAASAWALGQDLWMRLWDVCFG